MPSVGCQPVHPTDFTEVLEAQSLLTEYHTLLSPNPLDVKSAALDFPACEGHSHLQFAEQTKRMQSPDLQTGGSAGGLTSSQLIITFSNSEK